MIGRARTVLATMGVEEKTVDLNERMQAKVDELQQAHSAKAQMENQLRGIGTHILRLEGAITMLQEMGAQLPSSIVQTAGHPSAPAPAADPADEPDPRPDPPEPTP